MRISMSHDDHHYYLRQLRDRLCRQGAKFPFFRETHHTIKGNANECFDLLARMENTTGVRIDTKEFIWSNGFTIGQASTTENSPFTQCTVRVWADALEKIDATLETIAVSIATLSVNGPTFILDWHFFAEHGAVESTPVEELAVEALLDNAYLGLGAKPAEFVQAFLDSSASVLVLQGPPGTGKTRLIRYIAGEMSRLKKRLIGKSSG
jgi:hypothetical protein